MARNNYENDDVETLYVVMDEEEASHTEHTTSENFVWSRETTLLLIHEYLSRKEQFRDPKVKKRGLWTQIRNEFRERGYNVVEDGLDRKWRNLKKTYTTIKDNKRRTGRGAVAWEYYQFFEEIYFNDETINIPQTISSCKPVLFSPSSTFVSAACSSSSKNEENPITPVRKRPLLSSVNDSHTLDGNVVRKRPLLSSVIDSHTLDGNVGLSTSTRPQNVAETSITANKTKQEKITRNRALYNFRKKQLDLEEQRIAEIRLLRQAVEKSNELQQEKNQLIRELLLRRNNSDLDYNI